MGDSGEERGEGESGGESGEERERVGDSGKKGEREWGIVGRKGRESGEERERVGIVRDAHTKQQDNGNMHT